MTLHRPIPNDAKIVGAWVKVSPRGPNSFRYEIQLQTQSSEYRPRESGFGDATVALNLGFRASGRVMYAVSSTGEEQELVLPKEIIRKLDLADESRANRDRHANSMRDELFAWLAECGSPEAFETRGEPYVSRHWSGEPDKDREFVGESIVDRIQRLKLAREATMSKRLRWIFELWTAEREAGRTRREDEIIYTRLREWLIEDKRDEWRERGLRRSARKHRAQLVSMWAHEICDHARTVLVENTNYSAMKERPDESLPVEVATAIGRLRDACAPGEMRMEIERVCNKRGVLCRRVDAKNLTAVHHACGHKQDRRPNAIRATCEGCGEVYDQDQNFCVGLFERSGDAQWVGLARSQASTRMHADNRSSSIA